MKELEGTLEHKNKMEVTIQKKQQIERELIGKIIPHNGHKVFEINLITEQVNEATYLRSKDATFIFGQENPDKKEVLYREGYAYVSAMNKKNALKKFKQGKNGSKEVDLNPIKIKLF